MTFGTAIASGLSKSFTVEGRASRPEFWWFWVFHFVVPLILIFTIGPMMLGLSTFLGQILLVGGLLLYLLTIPGVFTAMVRRMHDIGKSGKPTGVLYLLVLGVAASVLVFLTTQFSFPMTRELVNGAGPGDNPAIFLVLGPLMLITGLIDVVFIGFFIMIIIQLVALPVIVLLLILGVGLARPSDPQANQWGAAPAGTGT
ncbi:MAG: DUF805 domain-containing protein [Roseovarius sp.]